MPKAVSDWRGEIRCFEICGPTTCANEMLFLYTNDM